MLTWIELSIERLVLWFQVRKAFALAAYSPHFFDHSYAQRFYLNIMKIVSHVFTAPVTKHSNEALQFGAVFFVLRLHLYRHLDNSQIFIAWQKFRRHQVISSQDSNRCKDDVVLGFFFFISNKIKLFLSVSNIFVFMRLQRAFIFRGWFAGTAKIPDFYWWCAHRQQ